MITKELGLFMLFKTSGSETAYKLIYIVPLLGERASPRSIYLKCKCIVLYVCIHVFEEQSAVI